MSQPGKVADGRRGVSDKHDVREGLGEIRDRTLELVSPLSDDALQRQHSPLMSPIIWDLGHIAEFEELWLVRELGKASGESALAEMYDAMRTPRSRRAELNLPDRSSVRERLRRVREAAERALETIDLSGPNPLIRDGYVFELVRGHEAQHQETILQTVLLMTSEPYRPGSRRELSTAAVATLGEMLPIPGGEFEMGAPEGGFAYDNERPRFRAPVAPFEIGRYPVTNGEYLEFIASSGYSNPRLWTETGWEWCTAQHLYAPLYWQPSGAGESPAAAEAAEVARADGLEGWMRRTSLGKEPVRSGDPVIHVCYHEAEAYARFRGARLPTEAEWEKAAAWDPDRGESRPYPWGNEPPAPHLANLGQIGFGVAVAGAYTAGRSAMGCEQLLGDVWEWTSSSFAGYPGFSPYPYPDYSEVFFGDNYRVLRGGSWATQPCVARNTFRNWDYPIRRQIFAGLRLARDV
jgi:iron(II)-dependent oxidoreductase